MASSASNFPANSMACSVIPKLEIPATQTHAPLSRLIVSTADLLFDQSRDPKIEPIPVIVPPIVRNRLTSGNDYISAGS